MPGHCVHEKFLRAIQDLIMMDLGKKCGGKYVFCNVQEIVLAR